LLTNIEYMCLLNSILDGADSSKRSLTLQVQLECETAKVVAEAKKHLLPLFQAPIGHDVSPIPHMHI
jgi:hypothetical protein